MTTCTLLNTLRGTTAALPLLLAGAAVGQPDVALPDIEIEDCIDEVQDAQAFPKLPLNEMRMGTLEEGDRATPDGHFVDAYDVELAAGQPYRLEVAGQGFTALIFLSTVEGGEIDGLAFDPDDTGFTFTVTRAGTYRVGAMTADPGDSGMYMVGFGESERAPAAAAGRSMATNNAGLAENERPADVEGMQMIQAVMDADDILLDDGKYFAFHQVELTAGTTYTIDVASTDFDAVGYLFDAADNQLATNDDAPQMGTNARITFTCQTAGTYSVGISTGLPGQTGGYQVTVAPQGANPGPRPGGDIEDTPAQEHNILLNVAGEADEENAFYAGDFRLEAGQRIVIQTYELSDGCDTVLQLRRSTDPDAVHDDDPVLAENDDHAGMLYSRIVYTAQEAGDYYLAVGTYEDSAGTFGVVVRDALPQREPIVAQDVEIEKDGQVLLGDFEFEQGLQWIVIETYDLQNGVDTVIELRKTVDPERASNDDPVIATNDDFFNSDLRSRLYFQCEEPGLYYVRVANIGKNTGTCTFAISFEE